MTRRYPYVVVKITDAVRGEALNAAIAVFDGQRADIHLPKRLDKLRALSTAFDLENFRTLIGRLPELDRLLVDNGTGEIGDRLAHLTELTGFEFSVPAWLDAPTHDAYETAIKGLLKHLVEPEPARLLPARKRTRLLSTVRNAFKAERVLAKKGEDLSSHRLVANYAIAEGLQADFILKNGAMHVIETVDASDDQSSARKIVSDIAVAALVLEQARMTFGETSTYAKLVYDASSTMERVATPSLQAAAHQGAILINWASGDDRQKLLLELASLATPIEAKTANPSMHITATTQGRLALN